MFAMQADVAELADAPDLGSGVPDVQVQVLSSAYGPRMGGFKTIRWKSYGLIFSVMAPEQAHIVFVQMGRMMAKIWLRTA